MDKEVRLTFGEFVLEHYNTREIILIGKISEAQVEFDLAIRCSADDLLAEPLIDIFANYDNEEYEDFYRMTVDAMYWLADLD